MKRSPFLLPLLLVSFAALARADGIAFRGRDLSSLRPLEQKEQRAALFHEDGVQRMVIAINFQAEPEDQAVWIFPVPGQPSRTKVEVRDRFPAFHGWDPRREAVRKLENPLELLLFSQLWPVFGLAVPMLARSRHFPASVHTEVEKWGIRAEVLTAESLNGLSAHLKQRGAAVPAEQLSLLQPYLSGKYVLIVAWIASRQQLRQEFPQLRFERLAHRWPCLYVEFPTDRAFYPLRPTSGYGNLEIDVLLFVQGHVRPESSPDLKKLPEVSHYLQFYFSSDLEKQLFFPDPDKLQELSKKEAEEVRDKGWGTFAPGGVRYTRIQFSGAARQLTDDLWFTPVELEETRYAERAGAILRWGRLPLFATLSYLAAGLSSLWLLGKWRGYAWFGLWNLLTILGLAIAVRVLPGERAAELRKVKFTSLFSVLFVGLFLLLDLLILSPLSATAYHWILSEAIFLALCLVLALVIRFHRTWLVTSLAWGLVILSVFVLGFGRLL